MRDLEQTVWTAIATVVLTLVVGFGMAGWVTGGTAQQMADAAAAAARAEPAAAACTADVVSAANP